MLFQLLYVILFFQGIQLSKLLKKYFLPISLNKDIITSIFVGISVIISVLISYSRLTTDTISQFLMIKLDLNIIRVLIVNTLLFIDITTFVIQQSFHKGLNFIHNKISKANFKILIIAPLLQQILFRSVFYQENQQNPLQFIILSSILFGICHSHKPIRKILKGKPIVLNQVIAQIFFTTIFGFYSAVIILKTHNLLAAICLHSYCNFLGPPRGTKKDLLGIILFLIGWNFILQTR